MMPRTHLVACPLLLLTLSASADVVVIVNRQNPIEQLSREQVADIFLGRSAVFPNGIKAMAIEQAESQPDYVAFHALVTGKNTIQLRAYWSKMVFSGQALPPIEVSPDKTLPLVRRSSNSIAYADRARVDDTVKVVFSADVSASQTTPAR